jgi:hypothetical protein
MPVLQATFTLAKIGRWLEGAQAMVNAKVQDHILKLLKSQSMVVLGWTCLLVAELLGHELTAPTILELNLSKQLMLLLR